MKKFGLIITIIMVVVCGGVIYGGLQMMKGKSDKPKADPNFTIVKKDNILVQVIETGTVDAVKAVEVKSRVAGRVLKLLVEEGDVVKQGQLIAIIDPKEARLALQQNEAQLRGARSQVVRSGIEIDQRRVTARLGVKRAEQHLAQLRLELAAQPTLTKTQIEAATRAFNGALEDRNQMVRVNHPNQITEANSAVDEATSNLNNAETEYNRRKELFGKGYISQRELESAELNIRLAKSRLQSAKERQSRISEQQRLDLRKMDEHIAELRANLQRTQVSRFQDDVKQKEYETALAQLSEAKAALHDVDALVASREQQQASVDQIQSVVSDSARQLSETEIRAPLDGIVTKKLIQEGELVSSLSSFSSGTPIVRIEDRNAMLVKLTVNEIDVVKLSLSMSSKVKVDAIPDKEYKGTIEKIAPTSTTSGTATSSTGQESPVVKYQLEILVSDADDKLKSGMSARCEMDVLRRDNVLTLPIDFVGKKKDGKRYVDVVVGKDKNGAKKTEERSVDVGAESGALIEIKSGLKDGDEIKRPNFTGPERKGAFMSGEGG